MEGTPIWLNDPLMCVMTIILSQVSDHQCDLGVKGQWPWSKVNVKNTYDQSLNSPYIFLVEFGTLIEDVVQMTTKVSGLWYKLAVKGQGQNIQYFKVQTFAAPYLLI